MVTALMEGMLRLRSYALVMLALSCNSEVFLHAQSETTWERQGVADQAQLTKPPLPGTGGEQGILKLDVLVTDKAGNPVPGLKQRDFTVLDNGQASEILAFHGFDASSVKANPPAEVILFLDSLGISRKMEEFDREEVERFLRQNGGHLRQPTSVYGISETGPWTVKEPSRDGNVLADQLVQGKVARWAGIQGSEDALNGLDRRDGSIDDSRRLRTFLDRYPENAAFQGVSAVAASARRRPGRKLMLWIGAGCCFGSGDYLPGPEDHYAKEKVFELAYWASTLFREAHVALYSFSEGEDPKDPALKNRAYEVSLEGPKSPADVSWMSLYKKTLAIQSGGRVMSPQSDRMGQVDELRDQINDVVREANAFYMLSIDPSHANHLNEYHALKVDVDRPGFTVRTKTAYYDQPYYVDLPDPALKRVTMEQVEAILKEDRGDRDAALAKQLSYLLLTERMTSAKLRNWMMVFRGKKTRAALTALSDASAFLDPPQDEVLKDAAPDESAQKKMLALVGDYLHKTMPKLPNFFATRTTVRYEDTPELYDFGIGIGFQPLHVAESVKATVLYRNGEEVVDGKNKSAAPDRVLMATHGTFGPLLRFVGDALASPDGLIWSRWERGAEGRVAVFRWSVPEERSSYSLVSCCLPDGAGDQSFAQRAAFLGEVAIDPETGTILRLQVKSDLLHDSPPSRTPESRFDIMIEYGATEIGGIPYTCPIRSVTISRIRTVIKVREWDQTFRTYGPYWTQLSDATFDNYHRFRSDARIVTDLPPVDE